MRDNAATVINNIIAKIIPNMVYRYHEDTGATGIHEKSIYRMLTAKLAKAIGGLSEGFIKIKISKVVVVDTSTDTRHLFIYMKNKPSAAAAIGANGETARAIAGYLKCQVHILLAEDTSAAIYRVDTSCSGNIAHIYSGVESDIATAIQLCGILTHDVYIPLNVAKRYAAQISSQVDYATVINRIQVSARMAWASNQCC